MDEIEDESVLDTGMTGSAQAVDHYEITRYGTLIAWAKQLGHGNAVSKSLKARPTGRSVRVPVISLPEPLIV